MFVSRSSWHYKLHCFVFTFFNWESYGIPTALKALVGKDTLWEHRPKSLCGYFWSTTILTALLPLISAAVIAVGIPLAAAFAVGGGLFKLHDLYRGWRPKKGPKKIGLAAQYLAARKSKVCPLITLVD